MCKCDSNTSDKILNLGIHVQWDGLGHSYENHRELNSYQKFLLSKSSWWGNSSSHIV